jgi:hypothetical protein
VPVAANGQFPCERKNHFHQKTATLVGKQALIVTRDPSIDNMTAPAKGLPFVRKHPKKEPVRKWLAS